MRSLHSYLHAELPLRARVSALLVAISSCVAPADCPVTPSAAPAATVSAIATASAEASAPPPARVELRDAAPPGAAAWASIEPEEAGFDRAALERIVEKAAATETSALLILKDGRVVVERYFGQKPRPIETMSMTKSLVSIAIGILLDEGKLASIDEPLSTYFPEFKKGKKAAITLRHVLTHTTGLAHGQGAAKMNKESDRLSYARSRDLEKEPGSTFSYNNEATQLLSGVVAKAAGVPLDTFMKQRVFEPLGITDVRWERDAAGNVQAFYGAALHARDLAKLGLLFASGGTHEKTQIVSADWIKKSTAPQGPSDFHGFLWWMRYGQGVAKVTAERLTQLESAGFTAAKKLEPLIGKSYPATQEREGFWLDAGALLEASERSALAAIASAGQKPLEVQKGTLIGFAADGWLGQQLIVIPGSGLVVVRQHEVPDRVFADDDYNQRVGYFSLGREVELAIAR